MTDKKKRYYSKKKKAVVTPETIAEKTVKAQVTKSSKSVNKDREKMDALIEPALTDIILTDWNELTPKEIADVHPAISTVEKSNGDKLHTIDLAKIGDVNANEFCDLLKDKNDNQVEFPSYYVHMLIGKGVLKHLKFEHNEDDINVFCYSDSISESDLNALKTISDFNMSFYSEKEFLNSRNEFVDIVKTGLERQRRQAKGEFGTKIKGDQNADKTTLLPNQSAPNKQVIKWGDL